MPAHFADSPQMEAIYKMLSVTQPPPAPEVIAKQYRPASVVDKAHINGRYDYMHTCTVNPSFKGDISCYFIIYYYYFHTSFYHLPVAAFLKFKFKCYPYKYVITLKASRRHNVLTVHKINVHYPNRNKSNGN